MSLSEHFTLSELTVTITGLKNIPTEAQINNLKLLCLNVLEPVRKLYGKPIYVNSGFRSRAVNSRVSKTYNSQHLQGLAADITSGNNIKLFKALIIFGEFDQLIWEKGTKFSPDWLHVSFSPTFNRKEIIINL